MAKYKTIFEFLSKQSFFFWGHPLHFFLLVGCLMTSFWLYTSQISWLPAPRTRTYISVEYQWSIISNVEYQIKWPNCKYALRVDWIWICRELIATWICFSVFYHSATKAGQVDWKLHFFIITLFRYFPAQTMLKISVLSLI